MIETIHLQLLLATFAGWVGRHQACVIAYLIEENRVRGNSQFVGLVVNEVLSKRTLKEIPRRVTNEAQFPGIGTKTLRLTQIYSLETPQKTQNIPRRVTIGEPLFTAVTPHSLTGTFHYPHFEGAGLKVQPFDVIYDVRKRPKF
jgi:hypothetical protein